MDFLLSSLFFFAKTSIQRHILELPLMIKSIYLMKFKKQCLLLLKKLLLSLNSYVFIKENILLTHYTHFNYFYYSSLTKNNLIHRNFSALLCTFQNTVFDNLSTCIWDRLNMMFLLCAQDWLRNIGQRTIPAHKKTGI